MNMALGEEISPVTPLPQTTRRRFHGIYTGKNIQIIFVDTPGIHRGDRRINEAMLQEAAAAVSQAGLDCLCYLVDLSREYGKEESLVASMVLKAKSPLLLVFTKKDLCPAIDPRMAQFFLRFPEFEARPAIAISAKDTEAGVRFLSALDPFIKNGPRYFDEDAVTDASLRTLAAEFIRKQVILVTRDEVPHAVFVEIESYREQENCHKITAVVHVETVGQKGIIIGKKAAVIEKIRKMAEKDMQRIVRCRVVVSCHIKVTPHWRNDKGFLKAIFMSN